jgi:hypothetical protein
MTEKLGREEHLDDEEKRARGISCANASPCQKWAYLTTDAAMLSSAQAQAMLKRVTAYADDGRSSARPYRRTVMPFDSKVFQTLNYAIWRNKNTKRVVNAAVLTLLNITSASLVFDKTVPVVPAFPRHLHCRFHVTMSITAGLGVAVHKNSFRRIPAHFFRSSMPFPDEC